MATATLISYPSSLCLAGNISPVRVSAAGLFTFRLKKGSAVLLEEDYVPDASGQAEIDIRDIILADLSLSLPDADVHKQASAVGSYTLTTDTDSKSFRAVLGGIDRPATDAATFLEANFLTWQPQIKSVTYNQPEWLSFYVWSTQTVLKARFYLKDGTTSDIVVAQGTAFDPNCIYSVDVQFSRIWSLGTGDRYGMFDVWVEDGTGKKYTYTQRYVLDTSGDERTVLVARNSLGGIDTFSFLGDMERAAEAEHTNVMYGETMLSGLVDLSRTYTVNAGILSRHERDWVWDLQRSTQAWVLMDGALRPVVMLAPAVTASMMEDSTGTVDFRLSDDRGYLNIQRLDTVPEGIEIPGPDGEVFFLAPRLVEFPDAVLDASLLLPVQSPFSESWSKLSVGALSSYLLSRVDERYESLVHTHDNLSVLNKFSVDSAGRLLFDGEAVGGGEGITDISGLVTLATEQTITGKKTFSEDVVLGGERQDGSYGRAFVPSHAGPGVYDLYISSEPIAGEIPSGSGGIDETELWSILGTSGTQQIDASHISNALAGYATQQWVEGRGYLTSSALTPYATQEWVQQQGYLTEDDLGSLDGYVTLDTAQTVTGAKTFSALLTASGGISGSNADLSGYLSAAKLYVPSYNGNKVYDLYVSNAPIAGEAPGGSGGLDEAELWSILTDGGSGERIVRAHLPLDAVYEEDLSGFLTSVSLATISDLNAGWDALLAAAPDFYSKGDVSELLDGYVTLATAQTVSGKKTFSALLTASRGLSGTNADLSGYVSAAKLYVPSSAGNKVYDLYVSDEPIAGEAPSGGGGLDEAALWSILTDGGSGERIAKAHLPLDVVYTSDISGFLTSVPAATASAYGGIKTGFPESGRNYPVELNSSGQAYVNVPWTDTTYTLSSFGITATADEINKLDGAGTLIHSGNYASYSYPTTIALISGLHASWDALLKASPSAYVTRWPSFSEVSGRPTTIDGYGITDAYTRTEVDGKLSAYLPLAGGTMNGAIRYIASVDNRYLTLGNTGLIWDFTDAAGGHAERWLGCKEPDGTIYTAMGVYGNIEGLRYLYIGGTYSSPWAVFKPSGNVGIGTTSPAYKLDVAGSIRATSNMYADQLFFENGSARLFFDSSSGTTWMQGVSGKPMRLSGMNATDLPDLYMMADRTRVSGDFVVGGRLYVPSYGGNNVYDIYISNAPVSGEAPSGSSGIDEAELWSILTDNAGGERIAKAHLPLDAVYDADLDGYALRTGSNATGTWPISISGNAAIATKATKAIYVIPNQRGNQGTIGGLKSALVSSMGNISVVNMPGQFFLTSGSNTDDIMEHWGDDGWAISAGSQTSMLRLDNYQSSTYGVFLVSGYNSDFYRLLKNGSAWKGPYTILDTGNYTSYVYSKSQADGRYMRIGTSGYPTAYRKVFNLNGTAWSFLGTTTDAPTAYAPTTAGTSGYVLQSTGDTPAWAAQNSLVVKGIYERSLGVAAGDTMADLKSALTTQMGSGLNKPGSMGFVTTTSVANIMSNWANDDYELVAGARTNFLRLDGYGSSTCGVFLVSGYQGSFYRLLKNSSTAWGGPYLILDTENYASTLDSRYVNVSGDTMTGTLTVPSLYVNAGAFIYESASHATRLTLNCTGGIARIYAINDSGSGYYDMSLGQTPGNSGALYFDASAARWGIGTTSPSYKLDVAGTLRATDIVASGRLFIPSYNGNDVYDLYISNAPVSGEAPSGVDETELWDILSDGGSGERIAKAHMPSDVLYTDDIQPLWYGRVSSTGTTAKRGGTGTIEVSRYATGRYRITGAPNTATVIAVPLSYTAGSDVSTTPQRSSIVVTRTSQFFEVNVYNMSDSYYNSYFYLLILS